MSCNEIEVSKNEQIIDVTDQKEIIDLVTVDSSEIDITNQKEVIELADELFNKVEVANINACFVSGFYEYFTPTQGQTVFTLSNIPNASQILLSKVFVNGQKIALTTCYTISGTQLTVILPYQLNSGDLLEIYY